MSDLIDTSTTQGQKTWAALCQKAFENLATDTPVTFFDVDAILTWVLPEYEEITAPLRPATARAERAEDAIQRVRVVHREHEGRCVACVEWCDCFDSTKGLRSDREVARAARLCPHGNVPWPCPTIAALDSTGPTGDTDE